MVDICFIIAHYSGKVNGANVCAQTGSELAAIFGQQHALATRQCGIGIQLDSCRIDRR